MTLCFIDTETTGLDPAQHHAVEIAWALDDGPIQTFVPWHMLDGADPKALEINGYFERDLDLAKEGDQEVTEGKVIRALRGVTLVGSNPAFDAAFLRKSFGFAPWKHRLIDVSNCAMWEFGWDEPKGLAEVVKALRDHGQDIPDPDHTAAGDVAVTRAVYRALVALRSAA
jgi:DNA polymerase III epsilon subunit-like protein